MVAEALTRDTPGFPSKIWRGSGPLRGAAVAGAIAGFFAAGVGSRVVMRVIAIVDSDSEGAGTDSGFTVGDATLSGTLNLLVFGAVLGIAGGLVYLGLRRWLFVPHWLRGATFGVVTLLTIGNVLFDTHNPDFQIFEPVVLVMVLFASLFFVNGLILASLADRIHPEPEYRPGRFVPWIATGAIAVVALFGLTGIAESFSTMIDDAGTCLSVLEPGSGCGVLASDVE
jgi:hypothetical protein